MNYKIAILSASILSLPLSGCVTTGADGVKTNRSQVTVVSGERTQIRRNWSVDNDCSSQGLPKVRVLEGPAHGQVSIVTEKLFPNTRRAKCRTQKVMGTVTYYTPDKGYVGPDRVKLRQSYPVNGVDDTKIDINVVR